MVAVFKIPAHPPSSSLLSLAFFPDSPRDSPHSIKENLTATDTRKTQEIHKKDTRWNELDPLSSFHLAATRVISVWFRRLVKQIFKFCIWCKAILVQNQFWCKTNFGAKRLYLSLQADRLELSIRLRLAWWWKDENRLFWSPSCRNGQWFVISIS